MKSLLGIIFSCIITSYFFDTDPHLNQGDRLFVVAQSGINVRSYPSTNHAILFGVGYGETVEVIESDTGSLDQIDEVWGNWVKVSYGNQVGYVFDGYLSKLPPVQNQDYTSNVDYMDRIKDFALLQLGPSMPKVTYHSLTDGDGEYKIDIHNLKQGCQYVEYNYCEGKDVELQLAGMRNVEVYYLVSKIFHDCTSLDTNKVMELENHKSLSFTVDAGYYVTIKKIDQKYSIFLEYGSCC